jgi:hypothetical protein
MSWILGVVLRGPDGPGVEMVMVGKYNVSGIHGPV